MQSSGGICSCNLLIVFLFSLNFFVFFDLLIGNFPLLGAVPDLLNAGISKGRAYMTDDPVLKAQYNVDAATNLVSAVPGPGDVVGFGATIDAITGNKGRDAIAANLMQQSTPVPEQRLLAQNRKGGYRKLKKRKKQIYG